MLDTYTLTTELIPIFVLFILGLGGSHSITQAGIELLILVSAF